MKITLLVKKETAKEKMSAIAKEIIVPFVKTMPDELKSKAGIYAQTPTDFGRECLIFMTTDQDRGLGPTFLEKDGVFKYIEISGLWGWTSK